MGISREDDQDTDHAEGEENLAESDEHAKRNDKQRRTRPAQAVEERKKMVGEEGELINLRWGNLD